ncbi:MAG: DNA polymerase zeta [Caeruleum heppii]|nr:MAG: DNA polymerase zeta [Caeruleum heppii]
MDVFRVRLNCVDHYQAVPTRFDPPVPLRHGAPPPTDPPRLPVIRVFGATQTGQKVCAHVHGALPYLYIEYKGSVMPSDVEAYMHRLHLSIDHALAVSYRRNLYEGKTNFVAHISLVKGVPFYGFHVGYRHFLKIYILNPLHMTRLADLLRQGTIMSKIFQPYESHLQYLLQWMCDYNLYGCGYIDCSKVQFRSPVPDYDDMDSAVHIWHDQSIAETMIADPDELPRQSHCSIEVDIQVQDILNRHDVKPRPLHHGFVERSHPLPLEEKLVHSMAGLWKDETRRRKARMRHPAPGSSPFPPEVMVSMSADARDTQKGGWIHEDDYREKMMEVIAEERRHGEDRNMTFDGFVPRTTLADKVPTTLDSVTELFPDHLQAIELSRDDSLPRGAGDGDASALSEVEVDESRIARLAALDFADDFNMERAENDEVLSRRRKDQVEPDRLHGDLSKAQVDGASDQGGENSEEQAEDVYAELQSDADQIETADGHGAQMAAMADSRDPAVAERGAAHKIEEPDTTMSRRENVHTVHGNRSRKRRKVIHDTPRAGSLADGARAEVLGLGRFPQPPPLDSGSKGHDQLNGPAKEVQYPAGQLDGHASGTAVSMADETLPGSGRGGRKGSAALENLFPVVKNPQDPDTILRLSQGSSSPRKTPQPSQGKTALVDFKSSSEDKSVKTLRSDSVATSDGTAASSQSRVQSLAHNIATSFLVPSDTRVFCFASQPPTASSVVGTLDNYGQQHVFYQDAYYSDEVDVPERAREYAGREFRLKSNTVPFLPDFVSVVREDGLGKAMAMTSDDKYKDPKFFPRRRWACTLRSWEIGDPPPTQQDVVEWMRQEDLKGASRQASSRVSSQRHDGAGWDGKVSQIEGPTQHHRHGFKYTQKEKTTSVQHEIQYMSLMSLEIHVNTRADLVPNPEQDEIACVFWCLQSDEEVLDSNGINEGTHVGIVALSEDARFAQNIRRQTAVRVERANSELDLINRMVDLVRAYDPDILTGFEVHNGSWGYMIERARCKYDYNLCDEFSRMKSQSHGRFGKENDRWGFNHTSTIRVTGRHMINIWRAMRSELNLLQYTMENVVFHLLHRRIPHYASRDLTAWYHSTRPRDLARVMDYYVSRVQLDLEILEQNELVPRTSEQARLLGVDFFSVFSRGSQYKVESLMFRIAKPENFLLVSPSRKQVGCQNALECLPLVMEPQSDFYTSPLLVLDFQSLYPSVMIAYNYCYSTFLGRIVNWRGRNKMGFSDYQREQRLLELLKDHVNIAPNGIMYVKPEIRKSLLAKMLGEILETRVMVKSGMKVDKEDKTLQRLLNNRQLALKLIANVTYGYTSASFSGRMPCSEIADSIVQTARETLEKAIALIHSVKRWGAEVVYGDTDSLFVYLRGRTKDEAFDIGQEMAQTITNLNPRPIKLKFEKVYFPCVLLAKKRYVGFKYESKEQQEPDFDAKGIETVRRDGTPAEQKIEETALKILFRTADLSQVKRYFQRQCGKIMKGKVSIQDFCFAKEVKLGTYSDKGLPPPGALISTRRMLADPRAEPQYGERVPYVVITGAPGARLIDRCVEPTTLLQNDQHELDAEYYISKNLIPPLERIFNLVGANVRSWYDEVPKVQRVRRVEGTRFAAAGTMMGDGASSKKTLESYMKSSLCLVCRDKLEGDGTLCPDCVTHPERSLMTVRQRLNKAQRRMGRTETVCRSCAGLAWGDDVRCDSKDCAVFYTRTRQMASLKSTTALLEPVVEGLGREDRRGYEW